VPGPGESLLTGRYACYGVYATADDGWLTVAAIEPRFWANLCRALGLDKWIAHQTDDDVQAAIRADLTAVLVTKSRDEWVATLAPADTCVAPVLSVPEVVADPQFAARGAFVTASHPSQGTFRQVAAVLAGMDPVADGGVARDAAETDTEKLLMAAGYGADEVAGLRAAGAVA
jgi:alpha-methylacyl-CoA racemase